MGLRVGRPRLDLGLRSLYLKYLDIKSRNVGRDGAGEGAEVTEPEAPQGMRMLQGEEGGDDSSWQGFPWRALPGLCGPWAGS